MTVSLVHREPSSHHSDGDVDTNSEVLTEAVRFAADQLSGRLSTALGPREAVDCEGPRGL